MSPKARERAERFWRALFPAKPVAIAESWEVDSKDMVHKSVKGAKATATLTSAEPRAGETIVTIRLELTFPLPQLPPETGASIPEGSEASMTTTIAAPLSGRAFPRRITMSASQGARGKEPFQRTETETTVEKGGEIPALEDAKPPVPKEPEQKK